VKHTNSAASARKSGGHNWHRAFAVPAVLSVTVFTACGAGWREDVGDGCVRLHDPDDVVTGQTCQVGPDCYAFSAPDGAAQETRCVDDAGCTTVSWPDGHVVTEC
jgi:hypothetical protein